MAKFVGWRKRWWEEDGGVTKKGEALGSFCVMEQGCVLVACEGYRIYCHKNDTAVLVGSLRTSLSRFLASCSRTDKVQTNNKAGREFVQKQSGAQGRWAAGEQQALGENCKDLVTFLVNLGEGFVAMSEV